MSPAVVPAKRFSEIYNIKEENRERVMGRGYFPSDLNLMAMLGSCSGYLSVLILALYVNSDHVTGLYSKPQWIWFICPIVLVWITRFWLVTHRGEMDEDPVHFALKDGYTYLTGALMALLVLLATPI